MPVTPDWSAAPDFLHCIVDYCLEHRPVTIVECSSGLTTLVLARCCQINDRGHVYSLENGEDFAAATSAVLEEFGLTWVRVRINKKGAVRNARDVGVVIERGEK